jgi:hypothetical protein
MANDDTMPSKVAWNPQLEKVLAQEAERCLCYSVLHRLCEQRYSKLNNFIALPVIVLSTLAGTASVGSSALFGDSPVSALAIGGVSITVGVLNTLGSYFGWARRAEAHKTSYVHYGKLHRFLMIELSLPPDQRMSASDLLKTMRDQVDRLFETSPAIPPQVVEAFKKAHAEEDITRPEVANGLDPIHVYDPATATATTAAAAAIKITVR